jgi:hypothetical protein
LSATALAVRHSILEAREPATLIFRELPTACGFDPIEVGAATNKPLKSFVKTLKLALDELRMALPELQDRLRKRLAEAFGLSGAFAECRTALADRAKQICLNVTEPKFKAFCLRLMDDALTESDWIESIGSHLALQPPSRWHDPDEDVFASELAYIAARFHRVESIVFSGNRVGKNASALRLAVTLANGVEHEQVIHFTAEEEHLMSDLQTRFAEMLAKNERLALAAASRAIWARLESAGQDSHE